jgi:hypothetical protein
MDVQVGIVERFPEGSEELLSAIGLAAAAARSTDVPVIYVRIAFRPNTPEVSRRNRVFAAFAESRTFALVILRDGCPDRDPEVHRVLMEKVFPRQADVLTTRDWVARLARSK